MWMVSWLGFRARESLEPEINKVWPIQEVPSWQRSFGWLMKSQRRGLTGSGRPNMMGSRFYVLFRLRHLGES